MKKLILFAFFCTLMTSNTKAQNWFWPEHRWVFHVSGGFAGLNQDFEMVAAADTMIQGHAARKWVFHSSGYFSLAPKFTYSNGPRAYSFASSLDSFVKIYDFSLPVGGIVTIPNEFGNLSYQIDSIDVVQAGDLLLKRQRVQSLNQNGQPSGWKFDILENAGMVGNPFELNYPTCSFVLLPDFECGSIADGYDFSFLCFSTPTGSFNPFSGSCLVAGTNDPSGIDFSIAPNPAADYFEIQLYDQSTALQVVELSDISGKKLQRWEGFQVRYPVNNLPSGVYFVALTFSNGTRVVQKLKHL